MVDTTCGLEIEIIGPLVVEEDSGDALLIEPTFCDGVGMLLHGVSDVELIDAQIALWTADPSSPILSKTLTSRVWQLPTCEVTFNPFRASSSSFAASSMSGNISTPIAASQLSKRKHKSVAQ